MSKDWVQDLADMHGHYGFHPKIEPLGKESLKKLLQFRIDFMQEELDEMKTALASDDWKSAEDTVDSLIDLCVVAIGTLDIFKIDSYKAWDAVREANMSKEVGIKASRPNPLGLPDLIKPPGWKSPTHAGNVGKLNEVFDK